MNDAATMSLGAETVFVDTNIFMYLAGDDPARRIRCRSALHAAVERRVTLTTSAEVLQEISWSGSIRWRSTDPDATGARPDPYPTVATLIATRQPSANARDATAGG